MSVNLLQTKLYAPRLRPSLVPRPRLIETLKQGLTGKLTLISAPAGFGKTTLVSAWLQQLDRPVAWLSLDAGDGELARFLAYLIAALQTVFPDAGKRPLALLQSPSPPPANFVLTELLNEITAVPEQLLLVLDDYHLLDAPAVDEALTFLLDHLPPQLHLVITTREDPTLSLPRLRARGLLTELRAADLRFTVAETAVFLQQTMGLNLTEAQIAALEARTEGWIAGLQMAALSMQQRTTADLDQFVANFTGSHRFVMDYLVEETLLHQPDAVRTFLLATAVLERLNGPLCAAVTQMSGAQEMLESLERQNLFVVPLDEQRHWYRYHHLFAEVLQAHTQAKRPELTIMSHQRASRWFAKQNARHKAIDHALAANDFELAAEQIELAWRSMDRSFQEVKWLKWVQTLPDTLVRTHPVLSAGYGWALLDTGQFAAAESRLQDAEQWLENPSSDMVVVDRREFEALPATLSAGRAYLSYGKGDMASTKQYAQKTLALLPADDHFYRGVPTVTLGMAQWAEGEMLAAADSFDVAIGHFLRADNLLFAVSGMVVLAQIKVRLGKLLEAIEINQQALQLIAQRDKPLFGSIAVLHRNLCQILCEQGELEAAWHHLNQSAKQSEQAGELEGEHRHEVAKATLAWAAGDLATAEEHLDRATAIYRLGRMAEYAPIEAIKCRIWLVQGELSRAQDWATQHNLSATDEPAFLREYEHLTLARLYMAYYRRNKKRTLLEDTFSLLNRLLQSARAEKRTGSEIECLLLLALAEDAQRNRQDAMTHLANSLRLAQPQGYMQLFVREGAPLADLLKTAVSHNIATSYATRLLSAFGETAVQQQPLVDPLSERELEILQLIAAGLKNKEIAEQLFISLNTVLYHNKNIYGKLGVRKRTVAVSKARELGLV